jgi:hypothetical protein
MQCLVALHDGGHAARLAANHRHRCNGDPYALMDGVAATRNAS